MGFRADVRAAAVTLLTGFRAANEGSLRQIYPGRPLSIHPPTAFIESITEAEIAYTPAGAQRTPAVAVRLVKGVFDSEDTVESNDAFVDDFVEYVLDNRYSAGANTLFLVESVEDDPVWVPDWVPDPQRAYYSTLVTLRGEALISGLT